jgi:putative Ca2+/H+ antiporter (TMEM165/GDT1 family)
LRQHTWSFQGHGASSTTPGKTFDHDASVQAGDAFWSFVLESGLGIFMESLLVSTGVVALAEIGDKTQLLAFILAARFKKPLPIIAGILVATIVNHGLAGALGAWITSAISPEVLRWVLGASFIGMAIWTMIPDEIDEDETQVAKRFGVFGATLVTFFLAEMGDKTQIATVAMAAHYATPVMVVIGTTLGMLIADVPAVFVGDKLANKIPMKLVHSIAAGVFAILGVATLLGAGARFGL